MATYVERGGFCGYCNDRVMVRRKGTNHVLHLLLSVCTFGGWVIVWLLSTIKFGGWRCGRCGSGAKASWLR